MHLKYQSTVFYKSILLSLILLIFLQPPPSLTPSLLSILRCSQMFQVNWVMVCHQARSLAAQPITPSDCGAWTTGHILRTSSAVWVWHRRLYVLHAVQNKMWTFQKCKFSLWWVIPPSIVALQDLLNIIYIEGNISALLDPESTTNVNADKAGDGQTAESRTGIRTICVSPDGKHLASGDRNGMLR